MLLHCVIVITILYQATSFEVKPELKIYNDIIALVPDGLVDGKIKESLKDIVKFADKIFSRVDKPPNHPLPVNLGLLRLYGQHMQYAPLPVTEEDESTSPPQNPTNEPLRVPEELISDALHYFGYANEAYNSNPRIIQQDMLLNNLQDKDSSNIKLPRHVVFLDHLTKSIVVSVRGTASISDMITDLYIEPYPFLEPSRNFFAHHGMAESAEALLPLVTAAIQEIRERMVDSDKIPIQRSWRPWEKQARTKQHRYADYNVVVTGHSLGAGTASLLAILLCMKSNISATAFAYAPPPTLSSIGTLPLLRSAKRRFFVPFPKFGRKKVPEPYYQIYAFVHNNDIISRSSHTQILSLISALAAVDDLKWTAFERGSILLRNSLTSDEAQVMQDSLRQRKHFTDGNDRDLYIAGDIYVLRPVVLSANASVTVDRGLPAKQLESTATNSSDAAQSNSTEAHTGANSTSPAGETNQQDKQEFSLNLFGHSLPLPSLPPLPPLPQLPGPAAAAGDAACNASDNVAHTLASGVDHAKDAVGSKVTEAQQQGNLPRLPSGNSSASSYYRAERVLDPRTMFNGLMYYGDAMIYDHLTIPFERALLQLRSDP